LYQALEGDISKYNSTIQKGLTDAMPLLKQIDERSRVIRDFEELEAQSSESRTRAATVQYQSQQVATEKIWNNVQSHRQAVARERARVYPIGPREPELEHQWLVQGRLDHLLPKDSRFKFVANTIDARRQYVDGLGRTEDELSEEEAVRYPEGAERKESAKPESEDVHSQRSWSQWLLAQVRKVESVWGRGQHHPAPA
jgi:hypothetical protein